MSWCNLQIILNGDLSEWYQNVLMQFAICLKWRLIRFAPLANWSDDNVSYNGDDNNDDNDSGDYGDDDKHCQRHNGPRHCFYNLNYLSSYKAGKFSSKEN